LTKPKLFTDWNWIQCQKASIISGGERERRLGLGS